VLCSQLQAGFPASFAISLTNQHQKSNVSRRHQVVSFQVGPRFPIPIYRDFRFWFFISISGCCCCTLRGRLAEDFALLPNLRKPPRLPRLDPAFLCDFMVPFDLLVALRERSGGAESLKARLFAGTGCRVVGVSSGGASSSIRMRSPCPRAQETTDRKRGTLYFEARLPRRESGRRRGVLGAWLFVQLQRSTASSSTGGESNGDSQG
jgi:hypothetical protein